MKEDIDNMSDEEFMNKYLELNSKGYSPNSPEMLELFKRRSASKQVAEKNVSHIQTRAKNSMQYSSNSNSTSSTRVRTRSKGFTESSSTSTKSGNTDSVKSNSTSVRTRSKKSAEYSSNSYKNEKPSYSTSDTKRKKNLEKKDVKKSTPTHLKITKSQANPRANLSHIIIDPYAGNYSLLDSNLKVIDTAECNMILKFFTRKHNLKKFKKQLNSDFKAYKKDCKQNKIKVDSEFKKINRKIKFYLWLCPDADYNILELLRKNITNINHNYSNYQSACAEYLHELTMLSEGDPKNLCFDINFATNDLIGSNHSYISNVIGKSQDPVKSYIQSYSTDDEYAKFRSNIHFENNYNKNSFSNTKSVRTSNTHDR